LTIALTIAGQHRRMTDVHLRKHEAARDCGGYEVWFDDGPPLKFFYFDDLPNRHGAAAFAPGDCGHESHVFDRVSFLGPSKLQRDELHSGSTAVAISSGIPVLNYDTYRLRYTDFDAAPGVLPIDNVSEFQSTLSRFIDDPVFAAEITSHQRSVMKYWACADGKSAERFAALIKDVVNRTTQQPFSILRLRPSHRHSNRVSFSN
jgi:hypothetical protein